MHPGREDVGPIGIWEEVDEPRAPENYKILWPELEDETHTPLTGEQGTLALMIEQNPDCHIKGSCWRGEDAQYSEALHFPKKTWDAANGEWI